MINWKKPRTEKFIEKQIKKHGVDSFMINWYNISQYQKLSEPFIEKYKDFVDWYYISKYQFLSELFIGKYCARVNWREIFISQKLSPTFIAINASNNSLYWHCVSRHQKLSESFIENYADKVPWHIIFEFQKLSESFIDRHKKRWEINKSNYNRSAQAIIKYQKLSEEYREKNNLKDPIDGLGLEIIDNWLYTSTEDKIKHIKKNTKYKIIDNKYIIAYKTVKEDNHSVFNFQYKYEVGKTYKSHCDCNLDNENSFGLSAWTKKEALRYHPRGKLIKVKINIEDIGAIVHSGSKIRCFKFKVLKEVNPFKRWFKKMVQKYF